MRSEMIVNARDVELARTSANSGLVGCEVRLDGGAKGAHDVRSEEAANARREEEGALAVRFVGSFLFRDPYEQLGGGSQNVGSPMLVKGSSVHGLAKEMRGEVHPEMKDLIRDAIGSRGGSDSREDGTGDVVAGKVGLVSYAASTVSEICVNNVLGSVESGDG